MGPRPVLGRGCSTRATTVRRRARGALVLTYRFWKTALAGDPVVIGTDASASARTAKVIGVLEPSVPYPEDTEISDAGS